MTSAQFAPELRTHRFEAWTGNFTRKLIDVTKISITMENRISQSVCYKRLENDTMQKIYASMGALVWEVVTTCVCDAQYSIMLNLLMLIFQMLIFHTCLMLYLL